MKKRIVLFIALILTVGSLAAVPKDEVRVALASEPSTINILELKTGIDVPVVLHMHDALMVSDPKTGKRAVKDSLSESITILPDNKSIRIKLRKDFFFHTGDPVTAHDVKFTYEEVVNPRNANMMAGMFEEIEEIEVIDDHNLIFHFYEPYAPWRELMWMGIASKKYFEKVGRKKFRKNPVGSGPFKFVRRRFGEYVELERFDKHPVYKVEYKTLKFIVLPDEVSRMSMLEIGELDIIRDVLPHQVKRLKQNKDIVIKRAPTYPSLVGLAGRPDNYPVLTDPNITKSMSRAINRQEIVDRVFLGEGYPLYMYASRSELGYEPDYKVPFDPEEAKRLLKKSSYKPGDPIILSYSNDIPNATMIAAMAQRYLENVGFTIKLQQLETGVKATYARNRDPREGHLSLFSWNGGRDPSNRLFLTVVSDSAYSSWTKRPKAKEIDALVKAQAREMDQAKRLKLLAKMHEYLRSPAVGPILFGINQIYAHSARIDYNWAPMEEFIFNLHRIKILK